MDEELSTDPFDFPSIPEPIRVAMKERRDMFRAAALAHFSIGLEEAEDMCEVITAPFREEGISLFGECHFTYGDQVRASLYVILTDLKDGNWQVRWEIDPREGAPV